MRITQVSAAIEAFCHSIAVARIANGVLNIRYFDSSALHALALYFDWRGRRRRKKAHTCANAGFVNRAGRLNLSQTQHHEDWP
jgi:hypothetical protein